jgi:DNA repair exonuclease SbcCD nuclease subunit
VRILHIADVHLDRPFAGLSPEGARAARVRVWETFRRCLALAAERSVDVVTIGGDLWEDEHVTRDTRASVVRVLEGVGVPVLLICGNHDPHLAGGNYQRTSWPANVRLFDQGELEEERFDGVSIWGLSWTGSTLDPSFLDDFRAPEDGQTHLLLLHGTATYMPGLVADRDYCAFAPTAVRRAGFAGCLAGHIHAASHRDDIVYPGSPEPLGWGEMGEHAAAIVDVTETDIAVELVPVADHRYREVEVDCEGCESGEETVERIDAMLAGQRDERTHLRVRLVGEVGRHCAIDRAAIEAHHREGLAELAVCDDTRPAYDLEALALQQTATGEFVRRLQAKIVEATQAADRERFEAALQIGLRALDGRRDLVDVD